MQANTDLMNFRKSLNLSQVAFAKSLGTQQSVIAMIEKGKRKASPAIKEALLSVYQYEYVEPDITQTVIPSTIIAIPIYKVSAAAGEGSLLPTEEPVKDFMYFDKRFLKQILKTENYKSLHLIYAQGDSMDSGWGQSDDIKDGDLLLVDSSQIAGNNHIYVILVNNMELRVKRIMKIGEALHISSRNSKYKDEIYYPDDTDVEIKIIGRVIWNGSKENV